jgi:hypothetical protein
MSARDGVQPQLEQIGLAALLGFMISPAAPQRMASADALRRRVGANAAIDNPLAA